jgi:hypothetical protein
VKTIIANDWLLASNTKKRKPFLIRWKPHAKAAAIYGYCHGLLPASATKWIIQTGGLRHE